MDEESVLRVLLVTSISRYNLAEVMLHLLSLTSDFYNIAWRQQGYFENWQITLMPTFQTLN